MVSKLCNSEGDRVATFTITDTTLYVPVVNLLTPQDNTKLLQQLKSGFKVKTNWNKFQTKLTTDRFETNIYITYFPGFHGINRLFVLLFENYAHRTRQTGYDVFPKVEIKDYNLTIGGETFFDQPVKI